MRFPFSGKEMHDLLKAWGTLSLAFAIAFSGGAAGLFEFGEAFFIWLLISAAAAGLGFLLHELAHKITAQAYGYWAEFRSFDNMLGITLILSLFGFIFAAPGAVFFRHGAMHISPRRQGKIALAGPLANLLLFAAFLAAGTYAAAPFMLKLCVVGARINAMLAAFNLIPFIGLDGSKVWAWSRIAWGIMIAISAAALMATGF